MDAAQRYQYDLHGFLHVPEALSADELAAARTAAHAATRAGEPFAVHCTPALAAMPFHPSIWPVVLELTDGKPMMRHSFGIHNSPRQNAEDGGLGGGPGAAQVGELDVSSLRDEDVLGLEVSEDQPVVVHARQRCRHLEP